MDRFSLTWLRVRNCVQFLTRVFTFLVSFSSDTIFAGKSAIIILYFMFIKSQKVILYIHTSTYKTRRVRYLPAKKILFSLLPAPTHNNANIGNILVHITYLFFRNIILKLSAKAFRASFSSRKNEFLL